MSSPYREGIPSGIELTTAYWVFYNIQIEGRNRPMITEMLCDDLQTVAVLIHEYRFHHDPSNLTPKKYIVVGFDALQRVDADKWDFASRVGLQEAQILEWKEEYGVIPPV